MSTTTSTAEGLGLRERKKRATRLSLQAAAVSLIRLHGPDSVTVEDICAQAEVSPRTFFNYFACKEEVLAPWSREALEWLPDGIVRRSAEQQPLTVVHGVLGDLLHHTMLSDTWRAQIMLLRDHPSLAHRTIVNTRALELCLVDGLARRLRRDSDDVYVKMVVAAAMAALRVTIQSWQESPEDTDPRTVLDTTFAHLESGLSPE